MFRKTEQILLKQTDAKFKEGIMEKLTKCAFVIMTSLLVNQGVEAQPMGRMVEESYPVERATLRGTLEMPAGMSAAQVKDFVKERFQANPAIERVRFAQLDAGATKAALVAVAAAAPGVVLVNGPLNQEGFIAFAKAASPRDLERVAIDREIFAKIPEKDRADLLAKEVAIVNGDQMFKAVKTPDGKFAWRSLSLPALNDAGIASSPTELSNAYQNFLSSSVSEGR